ncbi:MAG: zinc-binding dehydrogenase [Marinomonas colpomeniae]
MVRKNIEYRLNAFGDSSQIFPIKTELSEPAKGEVQLRMVAMGLSMADVLIRRGFYPDVKNPNVVMGYEGIGVIEALGSDVSETFPALTKGLQVAVMSITGNNTHFRNIEAKDVVPLPNSVSDADIPSVAALMLNYVTAYQMIHRQSLCFDDNTPTKRVLVHSASGGVGMAIVQLLASLNVDVYGTASAKNHQRLRHYGVTPIDYTHDDVASVCQKAGGMDIVFDGIGGSHLNLSNKCLAKKGSLVCYGMTELVKGKPESRLTFVKFLATSVRYLIKTKISSRYSFYSVTNMRSKQPKWFIEDFHHVFKLFKAGELQPDLAPVLPLSQLVKAHSNLEQGITVGKQVLVVETYSHLP